MVCVRVWRDEQSKISLTGRSAQRCSSKSRFVGKNPVKEHVLFSCDLLPDPLYARLEYAELIRTVLLFVSDRVYREASQFGKPTKTRDTTEMITTINFLSLISLSFPFIFKLWFYCCKNTSATSVAIISQKWVSCLLERVWAKP